MDYGYATLNLTPCHEARKEVRFRDQVNYSL